MCDEIKFTDEEWALVVEMLERERNELPVEIHHTRSSSVRAELHQREELVRNLLHRMRPPVAV